MTWLPFIYIGLPAILLALGYAVGKTVELTHTRSLEQRESELAHIVWSNLRTVPGDWRIDTSELVQGQAVIGSDYFKSYASRIRNFFGGRHRSLETVMDRARREALVRMLGQAQASGAQAVWNVRLTTSDIVSGGRKGLIAAEVYAYGTALRFHTD